MPDDLMLLIDHRDTRVRMNARALRIERPDTPPEHVPLGPLGLVVVHGSPMIGCDVWRALAERNIPAVLQPARGRGQVAVLGTALSATIAPRIAQHRAAADSHATLRIARWLLQAKLDAQREAARRLDPDGRDSAALARHQATAVDRIEQAASSAALLGIEGAAAAAWYRWLATRLPDDWTFDGRNRRPPQDPVNALLSLGYTLLAGEMLRAVQQLGLDPALGFLHGVVPGRDSLVLDLMEPLRPSVDLIVASLLCDLLLPSQFTHSARDGCRLNKTGRGAFYRAWAVTRSDWPNLSRRPADTTARGSAEPTLGETAPQTAAAAVDPAVSLQTLCRRLGAELVRRLRRHLPAGLPLQPTDDAADALPPTTDGDDEHG